MCNSEPVLFWQHDRAFLRPTRESACDSPLSLVPPHSSSAGPDRSGVVRIYVWLIMILSGGGGVDRVMQQC